MTNDSLFTRILFVCLLLLNLSLSRAADFEESSPQRSARPGLIRPRREHLKFPYRKEKLTERQAAAHLLSRFTFGANSVDVDRVIKIGLEEWFLHQLDADLPDDSLDRKLGSFKTLGLSNTEIVSGFPSQADLRKRLIKEGIISKDSIAAIDKKEYKLLLANYMTQKGIHQIKELLEDFQSQKILRARYSQNQLREVLTDFWFNHFNVSLNKDNCAYFIPSYERDVIRPHVLGKFQDLLLASAKSPAMLIYLDNRTSVGTNSADSNNAALRERKIAAQMALLSDTSSRKIAYQKRLKQTKRPNGLNENYARELMELHTLGVDGGYTQKDVTQAAKVLTGWSMFPMEKNKNRASLIAKLNEMGPDKRAKAGFVCDSNFIFYPNKHDNREKTILGKQFPAGGGYQEGVDLLQLLAHHRSTAAFITRKIAVRFVCDDPPKSLLARMKDAFLQSDGDIRKVLIAMCNSPEFWSAQALRQKTKSPFELAISALRVLDARVDQPLQIYNWITRMGQKLYSYQAPTGFPDRGQYWISTGALLTRMNFGLALASQRIPGISINLIKLNQNHEPESTQAALVSYASLMLPERNLSQTMKSLAPRLENQTSLAQVVGILLGSPEFQRR